MKFHNCHYCDSSVSELGSYVQISNKLWAHLKCFEKEALQQGRVEGRLEVLKEQQEAREAARNAEASDAVRRFNDAIRCLKCGVPMLSERPAVLPAAFSTVLPSVGQPDVCALCMRLEVQARNAARQAPVAGTTASLMQPKTPAPEAPSTLISGGRPIEID